MDIFKNIVKIEVTGGNIDNYIKKVIKSKINIIKLKKVNYKKVFLYVSYDDYLKLKEYRTIYEVKLVAKLGMFRIKKFFKKNMILFFIIIMGIILLYLLSNIVFDIKVIHSNPKIRNLLYEELNSNGIKKYTFKKNYKELDNIKEKILKDNKDKIEWLEIVENGTKYIIRVEERIKNNEIKDNKYKDIVASKNAVLTRVIAIVGEKVKFVNDYVNEGDIIITGNMLKPDNTSILLSAEGSVYGEVWYKVDIEYPYVYKEERITGKKKKVFVINFLNKRISLFDFDNYRVSNNIICANNLLPINISIENQQELNVIDEFLTEEEAVDKAIKSAKEKLVNNNDKIIDIKDVKVINKEFLVSKVKLKLFISVIEDIGIEKVIDISKLEKS